MFSTSRYAYIFCVAIMVHVHIFCVTDILDKVIQVLISVHKHKDNNKQTRTFKTPNKSIYQCDSKTRHVKRNRNEAKPDGFSEVEEYSKNQKKHA